jgi:hypothetical protein
MLVGPASDDDDHPEFDKYWAGTGAKLEMHEKIKDQMTQTMEQNSKHKAGMKHHIEDLKRKRRGIREGLEVQMRC